jgi:hypothetical protein
MLGAGPADSDARQARFRVTTRKPDDRVLTHTPGDQVIFSVTSPSGIGGATITRVVERWPAVIDVRLRLRGMEWLQISNGTVTLSASVASSADHRTMLWLSDGVQKEAPVNRGSPYWTEIRILDDQGRPAKGIPLKDGVFEITLPPPLFASNAPEMRLDWIDFFR